MRRTAPGRGARSGGGRRSAGAGARAGTSYATGQAGLNKYDGKTGALAMTVDFLPGTCDPHGLAFHNAKLLACDSGEHPAWPQKASPTSSWSFSHALV